jgi:hypothetical protein
LLARDSDLASLNRKAILSQFKPKTKTQNPILFATLEPQQDNKLTASFDDYTIKKHIRIDRYSKETGALISAICTESLSALDDCADGETVRLKKEPCKQLESENIT